MFLEHLEIQIFKILPLGANHGGAPCWTSTWHNSIDAKIRARDQPLNSTYQNAHTKKSWIIVIIVHRNPWLGNWNKLIIDLIVNIIIDYLKKAVLLLPTAVKA